MKKTIFALLACTAMMAPAMGSLTATVTITGLDNKYDGWYIASWSTITDANKYITTEAGEAAWATEFCNTVLSDDTMANFGTWAATYSLLDVYFPATKLTSTASGGSTIISGTFSASFSYTAPAQIEFVLLKDGWTPGSEYQLVLTNGAVSSKVVGDDTVFEIAANTEGNTVYHNVTATGGSGTLRTDKTPEPATATLSLLALAGLAARRRH